MCATFNNMGTDQKKAKLPLFAVKRPGHCFSLNGDSDNNDNHDSSPSPSASLPPSCKIGETEEDLSGVEHAGSVPRQSWLDPSVRQLKSKLITPGRRVDDDGKGNDPPSEADIFSPSSTDKEIVERSSEAAGHTKSSGSFLISNVVGGLFNKVSKMITPGRGVVEDGKGNKEEMKGNAEKEDDGLTDSVDTQSLIAPPKSQLTSKRSAAADLNNNTRKKRRRKKHNRHKNKTTSIDDPGTGAKVVKNPKNDTLLIGGANKRTCMPIAIAALLQGNPALMGAVLSSLLSAMPNEGDMKTSQAMKALAKHGMRLERVGKKYNKKGGYPYHLLKEDDCKLIIHIKLTNTKKQQMNHCIAWDGAMLHDQPHSIRVNNAYDRKPRFANKVFEKLYPKDKFLSFQITNVFQLQLAEQREGAVVDKKKGSNQ